MKRIKFRIYFLQKIPGPSLWHSPFPVVLSALLCVLRVSALSPLPLLESRAVTSFLFPRNFKKSFPTAVRGEGSWIFSSDGQSYLDASGQAAVVNIGHGVREVAQAMAEQASQFAFAHTTQFHSASAEKLAGAPARSCSAQFRQRPRLFHFGRFRSHRDRHQARAPIPSRIRNTKEVPRRFSPPELSRQHSRRHDCQRQRRSPSALSTTSSGLGPHRALLLLSLSFQQILPRLQTCLRRGSRIFSFCQ